MIVYIDYSNGDRFLAYVDTVAYTDGSITGQKGGKTFNKPISSRDEAWVLDSNGRMLHSLVLSLPLEEAEGW